MTLSRQHPEDHAAPAPHADTDARAAASSPSSPRFWRSLDELAAAPEFTQHLENEFPHGPNDPHTKFDRREILKVMAASAAFAGLTGCTKLPTQKILPYVRQPEEIVPGKALFYSTAMTLGGIAIGILAESQMARPTKIIPPVWALPTYSRRPPCYLFTIPIALAPSSTTGALRAGTNSSAKH